MLYFNVVLLVVAGFVFGWDKALYSIIFQYTTTQVVHTLYKRYQKKTLFIVTDNPQEVCEVIYATSRTARPSSEAKVPSTSRNAASSIPWCPATKARRVVHAVRKVDPHSFINTIKTQDLAGLFYQRPTL